MALISNKKGFFFTLITIALIALALLSYTIYASTNNSNSSRKRVETLQGFVESTESNFQRQTYISLFRMIFVMENQIALSGTYITNTQSAFQEMFFNGTFYGAEEPLLDGVTYADIVSTSTERALDTHATLDFTDPVLTVTQDDPWHVTATLTVQMLARDANGLVQWNKTEQITSRVSIESFEDPIYLVETNGAMTNQFRQTPYTSFVSGSDISNLSAHMTGAYYLASSQAPSFLMRLEGNLNSNAQGVESLVNLNTLATKGGTIRDTTVVDYIYFSENAPISYRIQGMPSWFKIDQSHLATYQVTNLTI